jgi:hypothetical protein
MCSQERRIDPACQAFGFFVKQLAQGSALAAIGNAKWSLHHKHAVRSAGCSLAVHIFSIEPDNGTAKFKFESAWTGAN